MTAKDRQAVYVSPEPSKLGQAHHIHSPGSPQIELMQLPNSEYLD